MNKQTQCVHSGNMVDEVTGGVNTPIHTSSVFKYVDSGKQQYPRYYNTPNQEAVVKKLCALEGAEDGMLFSSGMAAISTAIFGLINRGDHVILQDEIYGGTHAFVTNQFDKFGIEYSFTGRNVTDIERLIQNNTKLIYVETPTNPLLSLVDLQQVANLAKDKGVLTIVDNTFASPINQNPIALGIDVVCHSGTKYLGGHSDLCCGAVVSRKEIVEALWTTASDFGGNMNGQTCALLERSMKTLELRVRRQTENGFDLAQKLDNMNEIKMVYYPGLESHPGYEIARKQMHDFGAMVSFELTEDGPDIITFMKRLKLIAPALSLGGIESTICAPVLTSHKKMSSEERTRVGVSDQLLRFSVGIEHVDDLIYDIKQAIAGC